MEQSRETPDEESVGTQDEPIMDVDEVSDRAKLHGIAVQTIADLGAEHAVEEVEAVVLERSRESGIHASPADVSAAVRVAGHGAAPAAD